MLNGLHIETYGPRTIHKYYKDDELHRIGGPATITYIDNVLDCEEYRVNGDLHRIGGPALILYTSNATVVYYEAYYQSGEVHRIDGPARINYYSDGTLRSEAYYVNGKSVSKRKFMQKYKPQEHLDEMLKKAHTLPFQGKYEIEYISKDASLITFRRVD